MSLMMMNGKRFLLWAWWCAAGVASSNLQAPSLWPAPQFATFDTDPTSNILRTVSLVGGFLFDSTREYSETVKAILKQAESRFLTALLAKIPHNASRRPVNPNHKSIWELQGIHISITTDDEKLRHKVSESYRLEVRPPVDNDAYVILKAPTVYGVLHALQTLQQLLVFAWLDESGAPVYIAEGAPFQVLDYPTYPYRGLLIDTSRHYLPLHLILKNLDALAMNKMNVLHWHMVDSQSWPYQSKAFPELSAKGAYCTDCVYTLQQVSLVIREAALRGIRVVPEFDLPGHSQAVGASHPELLTQCLGKRSEPLDATKDEVYSFVHELYDEINSTFPDDWIHIGGDEVDLSCWQKNQAIQKWKKAHNMTEDLELLQFFETRLLTYLNKRIHKRPIAWQELFDSGLKIPKHVVVDVWKSWVRNETMHNATAQGFTVILSSCWYLDHLDQDIQQFYNCDPADFPGSATQKTFVAGGHASMWGERVDATDFFPRVWPRASATAEKLWTGASPEAKSTYFERLDLFHCFMMKQGIPASPLGPGSCTDSTSVRFAKGHPALMHSNTHSE